MKFSAERDKLAAALKHASRFCDPKSVIAIYGSVLLSANGSVLTITANNGTFALSLIVPVDVLEAGDICVPAIKITDLIATLRAETPVLVEHAGNHLLVRSGATKASFPVQDPILFPRLSSPNLNASPQITLPAGELDRVLGLSLPAMGQEDISRMMFYGLFLRFDQGEAVAASCDGFFGAVCRLNCDELAEFPAILLPRPVCVRLRTLLKGETGSVGITITPSLARISAGNWSVISKLIDVEFPDYRRWMARRVEQPILFDSDAFAAILTRIEAAVDFDNAKLKRRGAVAEVEAGTMKVRDGQALITDSMDVDYHGNPIRMGFNTTQFSEVLAALDAPEVELHFIDQGSPILICAKGVEDASFTATAYRV